MIYLIQSKLFEKRRGIESYKTEVNRAFGINIPAKAERTSKKLDGLLLIF